MFKTTLLFFLFPVFGMCQSMWTSNHIKAEFSQDDVVVMKLGTFFNNSQNAVAIHCEKYDYYVSLESTLVTLKMQYDSLLLDRDRQIRILSDELSNYTTKVNKRKKS